MELNNNMLLQLEAYFEDPQRYEPERWVRSEEPKTQNVHPYLLIPFGHGPRMCAGEYSWSLQFARVVVVGVKILDPTIDALPSLHPGDCDLLTNEHVLWRNRITGFASHF